jgi:hypothetical protein
VNEANRVPGLVVTRDGAHIAQGEWGVAIPVDPGEHLIAATADGRKAWQIRASVTEKEPSVSIEVPLLEALPPEPPLVPMEPHPMPVDPPPKPKGWSTWKTTGAITAGVGAAGLVVGGLIGLAAKGDYNSARAQCRDGPRGCPPSAIDEADAAYGLATGATVVFVVGAALLAGGATLFILDPSNGSATAAKNPPRRHFALTPSGLAGLW